MQVSGWQSHIHYAPIDWTRNYSNVERLCERGFVKMPPVEETLASYLSQSEVSSLKAPALASKPCQTTSWLVGKV